MGINTGWCELFSRLRNLKSLLWVSSEQDYIDCTDISDVIPFESGFDDDERTRISDMVMERMNAVFSEFQERPKVSVIILSQEYFRRWDVFYEGYLRDLDNFLPKSVRGWPQLVASETEDI
jgi:hypothetical protein